MVCILMEEKKKKKEFQQNYEQHSPPTPPPPEFCLLNVSLESGKENKTKDKVRRRVHAATPACFQVTEENQQQNLPDKESLQT